MVGWWFYKHGFQTIEGDERSRKIHRERKAGLVCWWFDHDGLLANQGRVDPTLIVLNGNRAFADGPSIITSLLQKIQWRFFVNQPS